jgi:heat shock protein HslJ
MKTRPRRPLAGRTQVASATLLAGLLISLGAAVRAAGPEPAAAPTASLVDSGILGEWIIEQARSAPITDKRNARLNFGADGSLSGNASCNALTTRYTLTGEALKLGAIATTRKACNEALLEQEDRVLTALERASRVAVPPHGFLTLWDADGAVLMRASRPGPKP